MFDLEADAEADPNAIVVVCTPETEAFGEGRTDAHSLSGVRLETVAWREPEALIRSLTERLKAPSPPGLLLVGRSRSELFRVQMRVEGRNLGRSNGFRPGVARSTAPVADMVRALTQAGLAAEASSDPEEDAGSTLLYRLLSDLPDGDAPPIGLLRAPASASGETLQLAIRAAAATLARRLAPARPRPF
jgi:hypothetical protein